MVRPVTVMVVVVIVVVRPVIVIVIVPVVSPNFASSLPKLDRINGDLSICLVIQRLILRGNRVSVGNIVSVVEDLANHLRAGRVVKTIVPVNEIVGKNLSNQ